MIDLILKLVDKLKELASIKEDKRKVFLDSVVRPLVSEFEVVHKGYLERFKEYRCSSALSEQTFDLERLRLLVQNDIRFRHHEPASLFAKLDVVQEFPQLIKALKFYLCWPIS